MSTWCVEPKKRKQTDLAIGLTTRYGGGGHGGGGHGGGGHGGGGHGGGGSVFERAVPLKKTWFFSL